MRAATAQIAATMPSPKARCICRYKGKGFARERVAAMGCVVHDPSLAVVKSDREPPQEPACENCVHFRPEGEIAGRCTETMGRSGRRSTRAGDHCNYHSFGSSDLACATVGASATASGEPDLGLRPDNPNPGTEAEGFSFDMSGVLGETPSGPIWKVAPVSQGGRPIIFVVGPGICLALPRGAAHALGTKLILADPPAGHA